MSYELEEAFEELMDMQDCKEKIKFAEIVANLALREKDYKKEFFGLYELAYNSTFHEDGYKNILNFPRFIELANNHVGEIAWEMNIPQSRLQRDVIYIEGLVLTAIDEYYQLKNHQYDEVLEDIKNRSLTYGYTLRKYYQILLENAINEEDREKALEYYPKFIKERRDITSDCRGCELTTEVMYKLFTDELEGITSLLDEVFDKRNDGCSTSKAVCVSEVLKYSLINNVKIDVSSYIRKNAKRISESDEYLSILMMYYSTFDIAKGVSLFTKYVPIVNKIKNPYDKCYFYAGGEILFEILNLKRKRGVVKLLLPKDLPCFREDGVYQIQALKNMCNEFFMEHKEEFEKNKGGDYFIKLEKIREAILENPEREG